MFSQTSWRDAAENHKCLAYNGISLACIFECVEAELERARSQFPGNKKMLHAFQEEAGELTKAMMDVDQDKAKPHEVFKEAVQSIAMAIRLIQEGDPDFKYRPKYKMYEEFL